MTLIFRCWLTTETRLIAITCACCRKQRKNDDDRTKFLHPSIVAHPPHIGIYELSTAFVLLNG